MQIWKTYKKLFQKKIILGIKKQLDILSSKSIMVNLKIYKPKCVLHLVGLSRPCGAHEKFK